MRILLLLAVLPVVSSAFPAAATPVVRSITVTGHTLLPSRRILLLFDLPPGSPYAHAAVTRGLRSIETEYFREGFYSAHVEVGDLSFSADSGAVDIALTVEEGRRSVVGSLTLAGPGEIPPGVFEEMLETTAGEPLRAGLLESDVDAVLRRYEHLGFPFARCSLAFVRLRPGREIDSLDLLLGVTSGPPVRIKEIRVEGVEETDPSVVIRESRVRTGDLFLTRTAESVRRRLGRLGIFAEVAEPELFMRNGDGGVILRVREGPANTFDGIVGYLPAPPGGGESTVTGYVSVVMRNLFGTGRKFSARWQRDDRFSREIAVRYREPWIAGLPVNIEGGFLQRQQDSLYVRNVFDGSMELLLSEELSGGVSVSIDRLIPSGDSLAPGGVRTSATGLGAFLRYDSRDDRISPTSGVSYSTDVQVGRRTRAALAGVPYSPGSVQRYGIDLEVFVPVGGLQVAAVGVHGRQVRMEEPEEGELERFGGTRTLRGYRENEFAGTSIVWGNMEYRILLTRRSYAFGFFDAGYYSRPASIRLHRPAQEGLKFGYGIGVLTDTPLGYLGVTFALGRGDAFGDGKVHVGLINEF